LKGNVIMAQKTFDGQTAAFLSKLITSFPGDITGDEMQQCISNPKGLRDAIHAWLRPTPALSQKLSIDRTHLFTPKFVGEGWSIWRGPADGNGLQGTEDQDVRSLYLTETDLGAIRFETMLRGNEASVGGEEKQRLLKTSGFIRLDAKIFQTLWENQYLIPESWKEKTNGDTTFIYFDGTILRNPGGDRYVLCLYWCGGQWNWGYSWLGRNWNANRPSGVLAS
jgi:hypothetical protein